MTKKQYILCYFLGNKNTQFIDEIKKISKKDIIHTIQGAEPIGPMHLTDIMIVAPASGNTMSKLACDIIDTPALMAVKSHLRNNLPVVIAPSTNNGLGANLVSIGSLINRKNYYFVPFKQDNPITKPRSIVFDSEYIIKTIKFLSNTSKLLSIMLISYIKFFSGLEMKENVFYVKIYFQERVNIMIFTKCCCKAPSFSCGDIRQLF